MLGRYLGILPVGQEYIRGLGRQKGQRLSNSIPEFYANSTFPPLSSSQLGVTDCLIFSKLTNDLSIK